MKSKEYKIIRNALKIALAGCILIQAPDMITYAQNAMGSKSEKNVIAEKNSKSVKSLDDVIENTIRNSKIISKYKVIDGYELKYIAKAIIDIESNGNENAVSPQKAVGLMQLMPQTVRFMNKKLGKKYSINDMKRPELNIEYGLDHLINKYNEFSSKEEGERIKFAIAGYLGIPKQIRSNNIKTWDDAVKNIKKWPKDRYGTDAKMYVAQVMNKYYQYAQENKVTYQIAKIYESSKRYLK